MTESTRTAAPHSSRCNNDRRRTLVLIIPFLLPLINTYGWLVNADEGVRRADVLLGGAYRGDGGAHHQGANVRNDPMGMAQVSSGQNSRPTFEACGGGCGSKRFPESRVMQGCLVPALEESLVEKLTSTEAIERNRLRAARGDDERDFKQALRHAFGSNHDPEDAPSFISSRVNKESTKDCFSGTCLFMKTCGRAPLNELSPEEGDSRMTRGERQVYGEWPSFVRIRTFWPNRFTHTNCGGVLISDRHVMTAGHCVFSSTGKVLAKTSNIEIILGDDILTKRDDYERLYKVERICLQNEFKRRMRKDSLEYDYSILTLSEKVHFNDHIQPACLQRASNFSSLDEGRNECWLVGAGLIQNKPNAQRSPSTIQKMPMRMESCSPYGIRDSDPTRHCWTKKGDPPGDSCNGDSGGPILCLNEKRRWTVAALVSYGSSRCDGSPPLGFAAVYTRIPNLIDLIEQVCRI